MKVNLAFVTCFLIFTCCASHTVKINSYPKGATVHYNGQYIGETPCKKVIKSSTADTIDNIIIQKKGYETVHFNLRYDGWADIPGCFWLPIIYPGIGIPSIWLNAPRNDIYMKLIPRQIDIIIKQMPGKTPEKQPEDVKKNMGN